MDLKSIAQFFGRTMFDRGQDLQDQGAVGEIGVVGPWTYRALVEGSRGDQFYGAWVRGDPGSGLEAVGCTCPTLGPCKHAAALTLELYDLGVWDPVPEEAPDTDDLAAVLKIRGEERKPSESVIPRRSKLSDGGRRKARFLDRVAPAKKPPRTIGGRSSWYGPPSRAWTSAWPSST